MQKGAGATVRNSAYLFISSFLKAPLFVNSDKEPGQFVHYTKAVMMNLGSKCSRASQGILRCGKGLADDADANNVTLPALGDAAAQQVKLTILITVAPHMMLVLESMASLCDRRDMLDLARQTMTSALLDELKKSVKEHCMLSPHGSLNYIVYDLFYIIPYSDSYES